MFCNFWGSNIFVVVFGKRSLFTLGGDVVNKYRSFEHFYGYLVFRIGVRFEFAVALSLVAWQTNGSSLGRSSRLTVFTGHNFFCANLWSVVLCSSGTSRCEASEDAVEPW